MRQLAHEIEMHEIHDTMVDEKAAKDERTDAKAAKDETIDAKAVRDERIDARVASEMIEIDDMAMIDERAARDDRTTRADAVEILIEADEVDTAVVEILIEAIEIEARDDHRMISMIDEVLKMILAEDIEDETIDNLVDLDNRDEIAEEVITRRTTPSPRMRKIEIRTSSQL